MKASMKIVPSFLMAVPAAVLAVSAVSDAALIASESFTGTTGTQLEGLNTGTGWTTEWNAQPSVQIYQPTVPLVYSSGAIAVNGGSTGAYAGSDATVVMDRFFAPQTGTVYFSFLFRHDAGTLDTNDFLSFTLNNDAINANSAGIGKPTNTNTSFTLRIGEGNGGDSPVGPTTIITGTTYLLVGKITKSATNYDMVSLFINPTTASEPAASLTDTASAADVTAGFATVTAFTVRTLNIDTDDRYVFDELKIGTTWASVIPEPSSALMAAGALGLFLARRRKFQDAGVS